MTIPWYVRHGLPADHERVASSSYRKSAGSTVIDIRSAARLAAMAHRRDLGEAEAVDWSIASHTATKATLRRYASHNTFW